ncbi:MAG: tetratricopeptide repeat protein [Acidobacteriota bacterium]|nr:tetratricopeptide repeat protein [Acidobacteriota bacterium]
MKSQALSSRASSSRAFPISALLLGLVLLGSLALPLPALAADSSISNAEVAFAFGLAAYHRGDYEEAEERFEEALAANPDHPTAGAWLQRARAAGDGAEEGGPPASSPDSLSVFGALPPWELELRAAVARDDNALLLSDDSRATVPDRGTFDGPTSDTVAQLGARIELRPLRDKGGWTLALVGEGYQALYDDLDFLDFTRLQGGVSLAWGGDPAGFTAGPLGYLRVPEAHRRLGLLLQARITDDSLDGEGLLTSTAVSGSLFLFQGNAGRTRLSATVTEQDYSDDGVGTFEASGTVTEAELAQTFYFGSRHRFLRLTAAAGQRDAGEAFDDDRFRGGGELALPLGNAWTLTLWGSVEQRERDRVESNPLFGIFPVDAAREDTLTRTGASLSWAVTPRLLLTARGSRTDRDADLGPVAEQFLDLDYQRTVVAVGLRWFFLGGGAR